MIADEGGPLLAVFAAARAESTEIPGNGSRGDPDVRNALFAPCGVLQGHPTNQVADAGWQRRAANRTRLPFPQNSECGAMPFEKCLRFHDDKGVAPCEESCEGDHGEADRASCAAWFYLAFGKQSKLLSQEEVLGNPSCPRREEQSEKSRQTRFYGGVGRTLSVQQPDGASTTTYSYSGNPTESDRSGGEMEEVHVRRGGQPDHGGGAGRGQSDNGIPIHVLCIRLLRSRRFAGVAEEGRQYHAKRFRSPIKAMFADVADDGRGDSQIGVAACNPVAHFRGRYR